jgi:cytochrome oxidase Cu insertion factor (SCO1/SenC/PrrC family)
MLALLAVLTLLAAPASAQDRLERGPKVGAAIPHSLAATDQYGKARDFASLAGRRGLILLFTRSLDW